MTKPSLSRASAIIAAGAVFLLAAITTTVVFRDSKPKQIEHQSGAATQRVLPPGTREAWLAYVNRRLAATLRRNREDVSLIEAGAPMRSIPLGASFDVQCDVLKGSGTVIFSPSSQAVVVQVFGPTAKPIQTVGAEPPLGVYRQSPAAVGLSDLLCKTIVDDVSAITRRGSIKAERG